MSSLKRKLIRLLHFLLAWAAYWFYGRPARKLIVVGVTGTKGKSTTCRLIASVLEAGGHKVGLMTTVEFQVADKRTLNNKKMTMLGRGEIQKMLGEMVKAGCRYAVIETSSQGILQFRHYGLHYDVVIFTNLAPEHVEAHGGFENLKHDKGVIFADLKKEPNKIFNNQKIPKIIIANADDENAPYYLGFQADEKWSYTMDSREMGIQHQVAGRILETTIQKSLFEVDGKNYQLNIPGTFNVSNALAAVAVGRSQKISDEKIVEGLQSVKKVEGRMEFVEEGQPFKVVVDYAHEPLSLTELFTNLRALLPTGGRLISLVGSDGGGRDVGKRRKMGEIAGKLCDIVFVTDVNCFDEDPREIAEMLAMGARDAGKIGNKDLIVQVDRRRAFEESFKMANPGDIIAITAKGTEPCIVQAHGHRLPWDDRAVAREILQKIYVQKNNP